MRGKRVRRRKTEKDAIYRSVLVSCLINRVMQCGKKRAAEGIVYGALQRLNESPEEALALLEQAVGNVLPREEVRSRRVGGATYQVPMPVKRDRAQTLAVRWIVQAAQRRTGSPMVDSLFQELQAAIRGEGAAVNKKAGIHRMADGNRAFAHFRW